MKVIAYKTIETQDYNLAPHQLASQHFSNPNFVKVSDFLERDLVSTDNGIEVGSDNYISTSQYRFLRAKSIQAKNYCINVTKESSMPISPKVFVDNQLREGDLLISKDSNIGDAAILDQDYPRAMISGALYRLPVEENKLYLFAFLKSENFKDQLNVLVPKGATMRHAGTKFLDCKVPLPEGAETTSVMEYIKVLTQVVINKEKAIKFKHTQIMRDLDEELKRGQNASNMFSFSPPTYKDISSTTRLDSGPLTKELQSIEFMIKNYQNGYKTVKSAGYKVYRGPNLAVSVLGLSVYSKSPKKNFYRLVQPVDLSDYGTVETDRYFGAKGAIPTLNEGDIIFGAEGSIGKCFVVCEETEKVVTNYHGMSIVNIKNSFSQSVLLGMFLLYLRELGYFELLSVGGQGGSFGKDKIENILVPNFPSSTSTQVSSLYFKRANTVISNSISDYIHDDNEWNKKAGIYQIHASSKKIKEKINEIFHSIAQRKPVTIDLEVGVK